MTKEGGTPCLSVRSMPGFISLTRTPDQAPCSLPVQWPEDSSETRWERKCLMSPRSVTTPSHKCDHKKLEQCDGPLSEKVNFVPQSGALLPQSLSLNQREVDL